MAKNTGRGHRKGAVKQRSEFQRGGTWFKRDTKTGRILNGSPKPHKGVRDEK
ncbi:hypothetical protein P3102_34225 [Amycolatopsis sp. QT-25]|uniref:hypothetical protein n=1 Tax=Amycolatopsis sp. QT-25 TaxID=3034022 RepID=UPI0023ECEF53|nr:hypothetical protein [Amycolatopsis sp. QT-25]WET79034.1 hypothetical protein P3102_34225 [Amycolatopsis sp. QT-25]